MANLTFYQNLKKMLLIRVGAVKNDAYCDTFARDFSLDVLKKTIASLNPKNVGVPLVRIGGKSDGGYLLPDDFDGIKHGFSPGVGEEYAFEMELKKRGIHIFSADGTIEKLPKGLCKDNFTEKNLGAHDGLGWMTMNRWMDELDTDKKNDLLLQMDIEGGEYPALLAMSDENLLRFRMIALEIHGMQYLAEPTVFGKFIAVIEKLTKHFDCVHLHPNNWASIAKYDDIELPEVFEISLLRKDRRQHEPKGTVLPHPLDAPNHIRVADIIMPEYWYDGSLN